MFIYQEAAATSGKLFDFQVLLKFKYFGREKNSQMKKNPLKSIKLKLKIHLLILFSLSIQDAKGKLFANC